PDFFFTQFIENGHNKLKERENALKHAVHALPDGTRPDCLQSLLSAVLHPPQAHMMHFSFFFQYITDICAISA
ncbi:MAG: hypothetical protein IKF68_02555, partial [Erysipelotrichaceae bacterium]|nr:hypothetical protein [Erysipelotrichaceae bacterium]